MPQTERLLLADVVDIGKICDAADCFQHFILAGALQFVFELDRTVKMIFNGLFRAACDDDDGIHAGGYGFFYNKLDGRLIHDGQHFLGLRLGGGQKTGTQASGRNNSFTNAHVFIS